MKYYIFLGLSVFMGALILIREDSKESYLGVASSLCLATICIIKILTSKEVDEEA